MIQLLISYKTKIIITCCHSQHLLSKEYKRTLWIIFVIFLEVKLVLDKPLKWKNNITSKVKVIYWYNFSARKFWQLSTEGFIRVYILWANHSKYFTSKHLYMLRKWEYLVENYVQQWWNGYINKLSCNIMIFRNSQWQKEMFPI